MLWAKGNLFLAENKPAEALRIAEHLLDSKRSSQQTQPIPALLKLKGEALFALKQFKKAERSLEGAKQGAEQRQALPLLWQIHARLGWLHKEQKNIEQERTRICQRTPGHPHAGSEYSRGEHCGQVSFRRRWNACQRKERFRSVSSEAEKFGGLTPGSGKWHGFVSQGKSNREIAEGLVLSERTVENHIGNILTKLGFHFTGPDCSLGGGKRFFGEKTEYSILKYLSIFHDGKPSSFCFNVTRSR